MRCKHCGATLKQGTVFCTVCGTMTDPEVRQPAPDPAPAPSPAQKKKTGLYLLAGIAAIAVIVVVIVLANGGNNSNSYAPYDQGTAVDWEPEDVEDTTAYEPYNWKDNVVYIFPDSDKRPLTGGDLEEMEWEEITLGRNEIFARHGRMFNTPEIAEYFNSKSWYQGTIPADDFDAEVLSQIEKDNVKFLQEYENRYFGVSFY